MKGREGKVELVSPPADLRVRAGFRAVEAEPLLAGGPTELEFFVDNVGDRALYLLVSGDRARLRPGSFSVNAILDGVALSDPYADIASIGGPAAVVAVEPATTYRQMIIVNQFVCLEESLNVLEPGAVGRLIITCRRPLPLAADRQAALTPAGDAPPLEVQLTLDVRRDDRQLSAAVQELVDEVRLGPRDHRERPLALLLTLRSPLAVSLWRTLLDHPDPVVVARVRQALELAERLGGR